MSKIRIKNFGPIKEGYLEKDGWMDIEKVTMFIGNQGSGKSTVAKLISTFSWLEKALLNGNLDESEADTNNFLTERCPYFRLQKYFKPDTELNYEGNYVNMSYARQLFDFHIKDHGSLYDIPKIMYAPAERSFLSSVEDADSISGLPWSLDTFRYENNRSLKALEGDLKLPFGNYRLRYDHFKRTSYILGDDYELELNAASSGLHSGVPLYLVSRDLAYGIADGKTDNSVSALNYNQQLKKKSELTGLRIDNIMSNEHLDDFKKQEEIIESKYRNSSFLNIVEEPEQNLFPTSQREILFRLLEFNNKTRGNRLVLTTHSPYLINDLTVSIGAFNLLEKIKTVGKSDILNDEVYKVIPKDNIVDPDELVIYEMDETSGTVNLLGNYRGLPSDENKLNEELGHTNDEYSKLIEIEKLCR